MSSDIALFTLTSPLHSELQKDASEEEFIIDIEKALGETFLYFGDDFSTYGRHKTNIIYVRTGGTEGLFAKLGLTEKVDNSKIRLLTSGESNSLAASMEILSYLRCNGMKGEIIHGSAQHIAGRLNAVEDEVCDGYSFLYPLPPIDLKGNRLGVIGKPSDWLISSSVDYEKVKNTLNAELTDIPIEELIDSVKERASKEKADLRSLRGSEIIYEVLKDIINKYVLSGLTLRCFDLLDTLHNTGCLALARLNAEGIPASCEGDIPALLTMSWLQITRGCPGFQCNLSKIDNDNLLFAHCTAPLSMATSYSFATHFESGIGTAIKAELKPGNVEIIKISSDLKHYVRIPGTLTDNLSLPNHCRTQVLVKVHQAGKYFLNQPLANHHIISYL